MESIQGPEYRDAASAELRPPAVPSPVMSWCAITPATPWTGTSECAVVKAADGGPAGSDFIDIITVAGPESNFSPRSRRPATTPS